MPQTVITCTPSEITKIKTYYQSFIQKNKPVGSVFFAKPVLCTITAYKSGKVLFQGARAAEEAERWAPAISTAGKHKPSKSTSPYDPPENIASLSIIGSDEVGTGDYFGPITVAAAWVKTEQIDELITLGVKDSKKCSDSQIIHLAEEIKPRIAYSLLTLPNPKYNQLRAEGLTQGKMKARLHNQALENIIQKQSGNSYDGILIDQFAKPYLYFNYLSDQSMIVRDRVFFSTKAESIHLSVAAASIIARQAFLEEMDHLSNQLGIRLPKGAGPKVDQVAAKLMNKEGEKILSQCAKIHFANTEKAKQLRRTNE